MPRDFDALMRPPRISVLLPVWNAERYVGETLASLRGQTFGDFEVVVVDDGSTDRTPEILAAQSGDPRVRIFRQENRGLVGALTAGLEHCRADYVARIDADDCAHPDRLRLQLEYLEKHPGVLALGSNLELIDECGRPAGLKDYPVGEERATAAMADGCSLAHPAVMMRKAAVVAAGGYRECCRHAEDYDLWLRLIEAGAVDNLPQRLLRYRVHAGSVTRKHGARQTMAAMAARVAHLRRKAGRPDPLVGIGRPLRPEDLERLSLSDKEEAWFMPSLFGLRGEEGEGSAEVQLLLRRSWSLREHLRRGVLVRHCLVPGSVELLRGGHARPALGWMARSLLTEPFSAAWTTARLLLGGRG